MPSIALIEPEIPQNTGNIARLCAAVESPLHIVGVTGFRMDDRAVRRAGLDYWDAVTINKHRDIDELYRALPKARFLYFSTKAEQSFWDCRFDSADCLVFGPETRGLPERLLKANWDRSLRIPMSNSKVRSLNLANSVAIALYESIRQISL